MPEGPEIRRAADEVAAWLEGHLIERVVFPLPRLRHHGRKLSGRTVTAVETRGKAMLTHFDNGYSIYSHNQLYGVWQVVKGKKLPETNRSLRLLPHCVRLAAEPSVRQTQVGPVCARLRVPVTKSPAVSAQMENAPTAASQPSQLMRRFSASSSRSSGGRSSGKPVQVVGP